MLWLSVGRTVARSGIRSLKNSGESVVVIASTVAWRDRRVLWQHYQRDSRNDVMQSFLGVSERDSKGGSF